jgi:hypothetical protein
MIEHAVVIVGGDPMWVVSSGRSERTRGLGTGFGTP